MLQSKDIYNTLTLYYFVKKQWVNDYMAVAGCIKAEGKDKRKVLMICQFLKNCPRYQRGETLHG